LLPLIYTNPVAAGILLAACLIWVLPEIVGTAKQTAKLARKDATVIDKGSMGILIALQWIGLALNFSLAGLYPAAAIALDRTALFGTGIALMLLGVALRWYAIRTLGGYFTRDVAVAPNQDVVQAGPYRFVRHPAYSGTLLTMLGVGLAVTNWASLVALMACVLAGHYYRVRVEEKAMLQSIGQPYAEYMRRTKRFIPLVF
jgi:protein-S-isoprenylcysteine O-methyltransferase Ste14